jgi:hypothetical protein
MVTCHFGLGEMVFPACVVPLADISGLLTGTGVAFEA